MCKCNCKWTLALLNRPPGAWDHEAGLLLLPQAVLRADQAREAHGERGLPACPVLACLVLSCLVLSGLSCSGLVLSFLSCSESACSV